MVELRSIKFAFENHQSFQIFIAFIFAFLTSSASFEAHAQGTCKQIAADYVACLEAGTRTYNVTMMGKGDFSYLTRCTDARDLAASRAGCNAQEQASDASAISQATQSTLQCEMTADDVAEAKAAGCRSRAGTTDPAKPGDEYPLVCTQYPPPPHNCAEVGGGKYYCSATLAEVVSLESPTGTPQCSAPKIDSGNASGTNCRGAAKGYPDDRIRQAMNNPQVVAAYRNLDASYADLESAIKKLEKSERSYGEIIWQGMERSNAAWTYTKAAISVLQKFSNIKKEAMKLSWGYFQDSVGADDIPFFEEGLEVLGVSSGVTTVAIAAEKALMPSPTVSNEQELYEVALSHYLAAADEYWQAIKRVDPVAYDQMQAIADGTSVNDAPSGLLTGDALTNANCPKIGPQQINGVGPG